MITTNTFTHSSIGLEEAKLFVRVDTDAHDSLLTMLIEAAQDECFARTHVVFGTATFTIKLWRICTQIALPYGPVTAVTEVRLDGEVAVLDTDYYVQDDLVIIAGSYVESVEIDFSAGQTLPADVKHAILQRTKYGYDYGDDLPSSKTPRFFDRVTDRYRLANTFAG